MRLGLIPVLALAFSVSSLWAQPELAYEAVQDWPQYPADYEPGAGMAVAYAGDGTIWYYNRGSHPVIQFAKDGTVLQAWKENPERSNHATSAHGMAVGPDGGIWLVGRETNTILKFSPEGRKLAVIGSFSARQGDNSAQYAFARPAAVDHDSHGNVYVADGYVNTRVVKYGPNGDYISHWGGKGTAQGQFNLVHGVTIDDRDRVYVADRGNNRIQVFDADGKFLDMWDGFGTPWALTYEPKEKVLWMCDGDAGRVYKLALDGKILGAFGSDGQAPGQLHQAHGIAVDDQGAVYVAETRNFRIQKFVPKR